VNDPNLPSRYYIGSLLFERKWLTADPFTLSASVSVVNDTSRTDAKLSVKVKKSWKVSPKFSPFLKLGVACNFSVDSSYRYRQPTAGAGFAWSVSRHDLLIVLSSLSYSWYPYGYSGTTLQNGVQDSTVNPSPGQNHPGKPVQHQTSSTTTTSSLEPRIPTISVTAMLSHNLTENLSVVMNYTFTRLDPGREMSLYTSHAVSAGLEYSLP
jgi:opacity protein-like surface antigen